MSRILFAGEHKYMTFISENLSREGHRVTQASGMEDILGHLESEMFDVVVSGSSFPEKEKKAIKEHVAAGDSRTKYVPLPDPPEARTAGLGNGGGGEEGDAMNCLSAINDAIAGIVEEDRKSASASPEIQENSPFYFGDFIGESEAIRKISAIVARVSGTDSTVLITGESGTGKELIARAIHANSNRRNAPMITINCGAIPHELLESELFGHEKGAFTGAHRTRVGRFELADGGTIFLDEIGDMSPDLQVKLLRVLQEKCFERVGGTRSIHTNVRIISATNKDLRKAIKENTFREDLYYRLNVIPITVPSLRERKKDIPLLVDHFIRRLDEKNSWGVKIFSPEAMAALCRYDWQGNVRELENMMERISVLVEKDVVDLEDLPEYISGLEPQVQDAISPLADFFENGM
jgi:DNA-binding NtrC family response regulator